MTPEQRAEKIVRALTRNTHHTIAAVYDSDEAESIVAFEVEQIIAEEREACAKVIPTTWLDPLLSGERAVLKGGPWDCPDIERLLDAIAAAIRART